MVLPNLGPKVPIPVILLYFLPTLAKEIHLLVLASPIEVLSYILETQLWLLEVMLITFLFWAVGVTPPKKSLLKMIVLGFSSPPPTLVALCLELFGGVGGLLIHWFSPAPVPDLIKILVQATRWTNLTAEEGQYFPWSHAYRRSVTTDEFSCHLGRTWHGGLLQENLQVPKEKGRVILVRRQSVCKNKQKFVTIYWNKNSESLW